MSVDKLRTNSSTLVPFVVSLSNHERKAFIQCFLDYMTSNTHPETF